MNDKVFLTKRPSEGRRKKCEENTWPERQKGKLNIFSAISVIFLTFNMFFASHIFQASARVLRKNAFIYLRPDIIKNDHHKWAQKCLLLRNEKRYFPPKRAPLDRIYGREQHRKMLCTIKRSMRPRAGNCS